MTSLKPDSLCPLFILGFLECEAIFLLIFSLSLFPSCLFVFYQRADLIRQQTPGVQLHTQTDDYRFIYIIYNETFTIKQLTLKMSEEKNTMLTANCLYNMSL